MTLFYNADNYTGGIRTLFGHVGKDLVSDGFGGTDPPVVDTGHWQSLEGVPHTRSVEMTNVLLEYDMPPDQKMLELEVEPNMPWAEMEFQERVGRQPNNPHVSVTSWPWYQADWKAEKEGFYSHTYCERYWPKWAGPNYAEMKDSTSVAWEPAHGVRFPVGDMQDVVDLLARHPGTRQAFAPVWFPEDTGAVHGERVPCSLGYHFLLRDGQLNVNYFIRSCDFLRYLRDDIYLTCRLTQWVVEQLHLALEMDEDPGVVPGRLTMFIGSLHVFEGDMPKMRKLYAS